MGCKLERSQGTVVGSGVGDCRVVSYAVHPGSTESTLLGSIC